MNPVLFHFAGDYFIDILQIKLIKRAGITVVCQTVQCLRVIFFSGKEHPAGSLRQIFFSPLPIGKAEGVLILGIAMVAFGGTEKIFPCHLEISFPADTVTAVYGITVFGIDVAVVCGFFEPVSGFFQIFFHSETSFITACQFILGIRMLLLGGGFKPFECLLRIGRYSGFAGAEISCQPILGIRITLL